jgi:hypothetical protein
VVCTGLTYRFGEHLAVDGVDLEIRPGETFGLLGPNGADKTTTIRMLTTLLKPAAGRVCVSGVDAAARPMLVRRMIGYVPPLLSADGTLTGRENVQLFARLFDVPRAERAARVANALAAMGLADAADRMANTYSGGMIAASSWPSPVPDRGHAGLAAGDQQGQPADLRGGGAARAARRNQHDPVAGFRRPGRRDRGRDHRVVAAAPPAGAVGHARSKQDANKR